MAYLHTSSYVHGARLRDIASYWSKIAKFLYPTCIFNAAA